MGRTSTASTPRTPSTAAKVVCRTCAGLLALTGALFGFAAALGLAERKFSGAVTLLVAAALLAAAAVWTARFPLRRGRGRGRLRAAARGAPLALAAAFTSFAALGMFLNGDHVPGAVLVAAALLCLRLARRRPAR
ncbi:hypothetical protein KDA82_04740, partial [Streptomyces daliensis]|nr:hypothetical protein [Streptomyces daliensis]